MVDTSDICIEMAPDSMEPSPVGFLDNRLAWSINRLRVNSLNAFGQEAMLVILYPQEKLDSSNIALGLLGINVSNALGGTWYVPYISSAVGGMATAIRRFFVVNSDSKILGLDHNRWVIIVGKSHLGSYFCDRKISIMEHGYLKISETDAIIDRFLSSKT